MPIKKSAEKYMRQTARRTAQNKIVKGVLKSAVRKTREAAQAGNLSEAKDLFKKAQKAIERQHRRRSSRRIPLPARSPA